MTLRTPRSGIPPTKKKPPIWEELEKLREKPGRSSNREPLSRLERLAILDGLCDGDAPGRISSQWNISTRTIRQSKSKLFDNPLSLFDYNVINHRGRECTSASSVASPSPDSACVRGTSSPTSSPTATSCQVQVLPPLIYNGTGLR